MTSADFAAAQRRVLARRQAREIAAKAKLRSEISFDPSTTLGRLPAPLQSLVKSAHSNWDTIKGREGTRPAFRVGQVDAELLDEELLDLLKGQVSEAFKYYGSHISDDWSSEILLVLRAVIFKLSIWDHDASYGAALQNLKYTDARYSSSVPSPPRFWQKALYGLVSVGGRYGWERWESYLLDIEGGYDEPAPYIKRLSNLTSRLSTIHTFAASASFLVFLVNGRYRTLLDRILRLRLTPTTSQVSREVSFEYLNRQLVWHAFTEFLLFLLPLVGISRWRKWVARAWKHARAFIRQRRDVGEDEDIKKGGELYFLPERTCAICYKDQNPSGSAEGELAAMTGGGGGGGGIVGSSLTDITNPYEAIPCGCVYCFVCIAQRLEAEDGDSWTCLRCGEPVTECKPWSGDVVEERSRSSSGKSVSFAEDGEKPREEMFENLEPMPEEDERTATATAEIEQDLSRSSQIDTWNGFEQVEEVEELEETEDDIENSPSQYLAAASLIQADDDEDEDELIEEEDMEEHEQSDSS